MFFDWSARLNFTVMDTIRERKRKSYIKRNESAPLNINSLVFVARIGNGYYIFKTRQRGTRTFLERGGRIINKLYSYANFKSD